MQNGIDAPIPAIVFDEFLVAHEWSWLLNYTLSRRADFENTGVLNDQGESSVDRSYRRSSVVFDVDSFSHVFTDRILRFWPTILDSLNLEWFQISGIEVQMTATGDGEFFRMHSDDGSEPVSSRALTFVYYYHTEPKPFTGGELRLYGTEYRNGHPEPNGSYRVVMPLQNQIVFFPSGTLHEVLQVDSPSQDFAGSRFTVNGWFHR